MNQSHLLVTAIILFASSLRAESRLGPAFERVRAGERAEEVFPKYDLSKLDLAEESPAILSALQGSSPLVARKAAGAALAILLLQPDAQTKSAARVIAPAIATHYHDADPEQPASGAPTDSWKEAVISFFVAADAIPDASLLRDITADLNHQGDYYGVTGRAAAVLLTRLHPIPPDVMDLLLAKMDGSEHERVEMLQIFGANKVGDPRAVGAVELALESGSTDQRRLAAQTLGQIGSAAKSALPALKRIRSDSGARVDRDTREAAEQAIQEIERR